MKKTVVLFLVLFLITGFLVGQTLTMSGVGVKGPSGQTASVGQTITVKVAYTPSGFGAEFDFVGGVSTSGTTATNTLYLTWYQNNDGTGSTTSNTVNIPEFDDQTYVNDEVNNRIVTFTLPSPPSNRLSFKIRTRVWGDDGDGGYVVTALTTSTAIAGYYAYVQLVNSAPTVSNIVINGTKKVGQNLTLSYTWSDAENDTQATSSFKWQRSDTLNGTYDDISDATSDNYTTVAADHDKYIRISIRPQASTGTQWGDWTNSTGVLIENSVPVATNVEITNPEAAKVGQRLHGSYSYSDVDTDAEGTSTFRWLRSPVNNANGTYTAISGATNDYYDVVSGDVNRYIKFEVTPRAATGATPGTAVLSDYSNQVTYAAIASVDPYPTTIHETNNNDGGVGEAYVTVKLSNASFISDPLTGITMTGLMPGLSVGTITTITSQEIRIGFTGNATAHEHACGNMDGADITVTIPESQMEGVTGNRTTTNGFYIDFKNNPPTSLARQETTNGRVLVGWNKPIGLKNPSNLVNFVVYRNNSQVGSVNYVNGTSSYTYEDTGVTNGTQYSYKIQAIYNNEGDSDDPYSSTVNATPLGITAFSLASVSGTIDHVNKTIKVILPAGTSTTQVATFTATGATVKIGGTTQTSGVTSNDFATPKTYSLTAADGSTNSYTVTVYVKLAAPTPDATFDATTSSFTAKWSEVASAVAYRLDVSTVSNFTSFLPGFENLNMGTVRTRIINGLSANQNYYYRVRTEGANADVLSDNSTTKTVTTNNVTAGHGNTRLYNSAATTVNVGNLTAGIYGTVTPNVIVDPTAFVAGADQEVVVNVDWKPTLNVGNPGNVGLRYKFETNNDSAVNGIYTLYYTGLMFDPTSVAWRYNGDVWHYINTANVNTTAKTVTVSLSGLKSNSKATHTLEIVTNDINGGTLPVELSSFTAVLMTGGKVQLNWVTQSETEVLGYYILRGVTDVLASAEIVSPMIQASNSSSEQTYTFTDNEIETNGMYYYWLQSVDNDQTINYYGPKILFVDISGSDVPVIPSKTQLKNPYPNPFNPNVWIVYDIAERTPVELYIYNSRGQYISTIYKGMRDPAQYKQSWDGKDNNNNPVAAGIYYVRMIAGQTKSVQKLMLIK